MDVPYQLQIFRKRDFGDIIGDSFKILLKNIKPLTMGFLVFVMPIFLLAAGVVAMLGGDAIKKVVNQDLGSIGDIGSFMTGIGFLYLGLIVCYMMLWSLVFSALKTYKDKGSEVITFEELKESFYKYVGRVSASFFIFLICLMVPFGAICGVLAVISPVALGLSMIVLLPLFFYYSINFSFFSYALVEEDLDFLDGIKRSFYLIKENWWATFAILLVAGIVASLISYIFGIPYYIYVFTHALSSTSTGAGIETFGYMTAIYYMISLLGSLYASMYTSTATVLKYYDLVERKDAVALKEKIYSLGTEKDSFFENEGEF